MSFQVFKSPPIKEKEISLPMESTQHNDHGNVKEYLLFLLEKKELKDEKKISHLFWLLHIKDFFVNFKLILFILIFKSYENLAPYLHP